MRISDWSSDVCSSDLANGANDLAGLSHWEMGGYRPADIQVVSAWDIDRRKVGRDVAEAIFAPPNCTARFCEAVGPTGAVVQMAPVLDGYPEIGRAHV